MNTIEQYKKFLVIDKRNLDGEVQKQAERYWDVAERCAEAISLRDSLKEEKDKVWSEQFIKNKVESKLDGKAISDKVAETYADSSPEFSKATKDFLDAKLDAELWIGMKESWQQRAVMLRELCGLNISMGYGEMVVRNKPLSDTLYEETRKKMRKE